MSEKVIAARTAFAEAFLNHARFEMGFEGRSDSLAYATIPADPESKHYVGTPSDVCAALRSIEIGPDERIEFQSADFSDGPKISQQGWEIVAYLGKTSDDPRAHPNCAPGVFGKEQEQPTREEIREGLFEMLGLNDPDPEEDSFDADLL
jgi:hypothetical protein